MVLPNLVHQQNLPKSFRSTMMELLCPKLLARCAAVSNQCRQQMSELDLRQGKYGSSSASVPILGPGTRCSETCLPKELYRPTENQRHLVLQRRCSSQGQLQEHGKTPPEDPRRPVQELQATTPKNAAG